VERFSEVDCKYFDSIIQRILIWEICKLGGEGGVEGRGSKDGGRCVTISTLVHNEFIIFFVIIQID